MECERLQRLVRNWYAQVQDEAMAPARMALFLENHIAECQTCLADPLIRQEVEKITAIILPPSKVRKPSSELDEENPEPEAEETEEGAEENNGEGDEEGFGEGEEEDI